MASSFSLLIYETTSEGRFRLKNEDPLPLPERAPLILDGKRDVEIPELMEAVSQTLSKLHKFDGWYICTNR